MGGSRKGKRSMGKSKPNKPNTIREMPGKLNSKLDLGQASSSNNPVAKYINPNKRNIDFSTTIPYVECELEEFLHVKLNELYNTAREWLLKSGYSMAEVETAILNAGHIHGQMDLLNNIVANSIGYLQKKTEPVGEGFENRDGLYKTMIEALVDRTMQNRPDMNRSKAMWHLIITSWDYFPSPAETSHPQSSGHSENRDGDDDDGVIEAFAAAKFLYGLRFDSLSEDGFPETTKRIAGMERKIGVAQVIQDDANISSSFEDPKSALVVDSVKEIRDLHVKAQKEWWAQRKVIMDSAKLQKLKMEKEMEKMKNEKICSEMSAKLLEAEQSVQQANREASFVNDAVKRMEIENDRITAEIEAFKLNALESERELKKILKRQTRYTKKLADMEKQASVLRSQCEEEKQRALQLEQELLETEKEAKETEMKWKQTLKEKEEMLALMAQETKNAEIRKAHSRAQLQKLRQQVEIDSRLASDKCQRLENELFHLRESQSRPIEELLPENLDFLYCYDDAMSSESIAPCEPSQWICIICMKNEVSVLLLPCTHQVICHSCYLKKSQAVGACCPYCGIGIENAVKVYGSSS